MLKPPGAVEVLARNARARIARQRDRYGPPHEIKLLADFGPPGHEALFNIFRDVGEMPSGVKIAQLLALKKFEPAAQRRSAHVAGKAGRFASATERYWC